MDKTIAKKQPNHKSYIDKLQECPSHPPLVHSWYNKPAHILRKHASKGLVVCRCLIKDLEVTAEKDGNVRLRVEFNEDQKFKSATVTPMFLLMTNTQYGLVLVNSEPEEDQAVSPILPAERLGLLQCSNYVKVLSFEQKRKLEFVMKEVNLQVEHLNEIPRVKDGFNLLERATVPSELE